MKRTPVGLGEIKVSTDPQERLCVFGLGSCVALYLFADKAPIVGLAHVVLPDSTGRAGGEVGRYADTAVPQLLAALQIEGAYPRQIRAAIAGGAAVLGFTSEIGRKNVEAVRQRLEAVGIPLVHEDTGGPQGRSVEFDPQTKTLEVRVLSAPSL